MKCHIDIETYSEADLKESGVYVYAEHESTEALCCCYRFDDGPVKCWIITDAVTPGLLAELNQKLMAKHGLGNYVIIIKCTTPHDLVEHVLSGGWMVAHNAQFERVVLNGTAGRKIGFPKLAIEQMICTAVKARTYGLPGALGPACLAIGTAKKDETGKGIVLKLCRPRTGKVKRYSYEEAQSDYAHLFAYCVDDVFAECGLDYAIPDITAEELAVWRLDQRVNDRGVGVDLETIGHIRYLIEQYKAYLEVECIKLIGCQPTQREKIANWVRAQGYSMLDMTAESVNRAVADEDCPKDVKRALRIYSTYNMKAVAKYESIVNACAKDGRIHGMMMYYGAGTGRWSSMIVQLQNLYRPVINDPDTAIDAYKERDLDLIRFLYPAIDPMKVFASTVRGMFVPGPNRDLMASDYAGIESRFIAWLFDESWKVQVFLDSDADEKAPDSYMVAYGNSMGIDPRDVTKYERQIGKVMELALGYEGGVGAFVTMAATYKLDLFELADKVWDKLPPWALESAEWMWFNIECKRGNPTKLPQKVYMAIDGIKQVWRASHKQIKQGWADTIEAAKLAVLHPGKAYGIPNKKLVFKVKDRWLHMRLPSGRTLKYFDPELHYKGKDGKGRKLEPATVFEDEAEALKSVYLTYMGVDSRTRQWKRESTYGGKLVENAVQGGSNDLIRDGLLNLDAGGYLVVFSVHDEAVVEVARNFGSLEEMDELLCRKKAWAAGLPVVAEGYRAVRYRKG